MILREFPLRRSQRRLRELIDKEGWDVEDKAVRYIAKMADGSMRDSLESSGSVCGILYWMRQLTYDHVLEVLGAVDTEVFSRLSKTAAGDGCTCR